MAKKKTVKKKSKATTGQQKLKGVTFCLAGKWESWNRDWLTKPLRAAGGSFTNKVTKSLDYLIVRPQRAGTKTAAEKQAAKLNANQGAAIKVIDEKAAVALIAPTRDEAIAWLRAGSRKQLERWDSLVNALWNTSNKVDLRKADLSNVKLSSTCLSAAEIDGANFRGASLEDVMLDDANALRLDGARLQNLQLESLANCSAKKLHAVDVEFGKAEDCNFDGAVFEETTVVQVRKSSFKKAKCRALNTAGWSRRRPVLIDCDFTGADLTRAFLAEGDLSGSVFRGAKLVEADLRRCKLRGADLRKVDLRGAQLNGADLTNAIVDGANFEGAKLIDAKLKGVDCAKAKGLDPQQAAVASRRPALDELDKIAGKADCITIKAEAALQKDYVEFEVTGNATENVFRCECDDGMFDDDSTGRPYSRALLELVQWWPDAELRVDSVKASGSGCPVKGKRLKEMAVAAFQEAFGVGSPEEEETGTQKKKGRSQAQIRDDLLEELLGKGGVRKFNAHTPAEIAKAGSFRKSDFSGAALNLVKFTKLDLQSANFEGAALSRARFDQCKCNKASFRNATLKSANLKGSTFNGSDLTGADLGKANLTQCSLRKAVMTGATLQGANLSQADLIGADLASADLKGVKLSKARFDGTTRFPQGFRLPDSMDWQGKGPNPAQRPVRKMKVGSLSTEDFMKRLSNSVDRGRLSKALAMLKADRFQLFVDVKDDNLVGVIKSQTNQKLVYSCQLKQDGSFACCTQNLNICGGLRGALCKHLLVLIVGLAKSGDIDAAEVDNWIAASKAHKPALDKDMMSETLLRYKGAEAGEIDWRPTETVPEDYYAF